MDNNNSVILSIVIPSYNSAKLLSRCIFALENQSAKKASFEITVADDGSTDETVEMLENFQARTELKLQWTTIKNSGPATARNTGVSISSGPWIGFLDADVIPNPDWVETALELIKIIRMQEHLRDAPRSPRQGKPHHSRIKRKILKADATPPVI